MLPGVRGSRSSHCSFLAICSVVLCICSALNTHVEATTFTNLRMANNLHKRVSSLRELEQTKAAKDKNVPEWPEDDDDDDINISQTKELDPGSNVVQEENESVDQTDNISVSVSAKNSTSEFNVDESAISSSEQTEQLSIEPNDGGADEEIIANVGSVDSAGIQQQDQNDEINTKLRESEKVHDGAGDIDSDILNAEEGSPSMEYHRSQSTVQNEVINDETQLGSFDESKIINNDQLPESMNTGDEINVDNYENNDMTPLEGGEIANANNVGDNVPSMEQTDQNQPSQSENTYVQNYNEDDEEESFLAMIQSTLQVLFLAAFFSSMLVFRKRVQSRMSDDPSLDSSQAIKEEIVNVLTSFVSWLSENQNNDINRNDGSRFVMPTIAEGGSSVGGFGSSSSRGETIPLATATDEEWGWDDEDVGGNLELPGSREDNTNEDDDLAMAIAMSLSESAKTVPKESTAVPKDGATKQSLPVPSPAPAVVEQPRQQITAQPADTIEDLLGQMSSSGGPVISSFGQKSKAVPKSKPKPINDGTDDIFASMGLSSFHTKSAPPPQPKQNTPSTILKAESIDESDDWGDDGDLDDLLLED